MNYKNTVHTHWCDFNGVEEFELNRHSFQFGLEYGLTKLTITVLFHI